MPCGIVRFQDSRLSVFTISESMCFAAIEDMQATNKKTTFDFFSPKYHSNIGSLVSLYTL